MQGQASDIDAAEAYLAERREGTFRWGTRCLRGGSQIYNPCVLNTTGWENFYQSLPVDYDVRNDPVFDLSRSTYHRLGDLGFSWPEPATREATRTGFCGPDKNSLTRPGYLRFIENDKRPEPAFRTHLTDRTSLHHLRADSLEGVMPYGRQGDMSDAKSVMHRDFKWRKKCCATRPEERPPTFESRVHRFIKTDLCQVGPEMLDRVVKFRDENLIDDFKKQSLLKLKKAYHWPINPITREPLGGRLYYYPNSDQDQNDACAESREKIWPFGDKKIVDTSNPIVIPDCRCYHLAHGPRKENRNLDGINWKFNSSELDHRRQTENCCEEIPYRYCDDTPAECCFCKVETKPPPKDTSNICPPNPPCPNIK